MAQECSSRTHLIETVYAIIKERHEISKHTLFSLAVKQLGEGLKKSRLEYALGRLKESGRIKYDYEFKVWGMV